MANVPGALQYSFGVSKQSGEGSMIATADALVPAWGGEFQANQDVQPFSVNDTSNMVPGHYKRSAGWSGSVQFGGFTASAAAFYESLLGSDTKTLAGPYLHTLKIADPNTTWWTFWQKRPDGSSGLWERYEDGVITSVEASWAPGEPVKLGVEAMGKTMTVATGPTVTNTITEAYVTNSYVPTGAGVTAGAFAWPASGGVVNQPDWFTSIGATLKYAVSGVSPAADSPQYIESGSVKITRKTEYIQTGALTPSFRMQSLFDVALSATMVFKDYNAYRNSYFGASGGTTLSQTLTIGSLDFLFPSMQAGGRGLEIYVPGATGTVGGMVILADPPAVDPNGGAVRVSISGRFAKAASGDAIVVTAENDVSSAI